MFYKSIDWAFCFASKTTNLTWCNSFTSGLRHLGQRWLHNQVLEAETLFSAGSSEVVCNVRCVCARAIPGKQISLLYKLQTPIDWHRWNLLVLRRAKSCNKLCMLLAVIGAQWHTGFKTGLQWGRLMNMESSMFVMQIMLIWLLASELNQ